MTATLKKVLSGLYLDIKLKLRGKNRDLYDFSQNMKTVKKIMIMSYQASEMTGHMEDFENELKSVFPNTEVTHLDPSAIGDENKSWLGLPDKQYLDDLRFKDPDMFIDLNLNSDQLTSYICAAVGAPLRLNYASGRYDYVYNLHVRSDPEKPVSEQLDNIILQIKNLKGSVS